MKRSFPFFALLLLLVVLFAPRSAAEDVPHEHIWEFVSHTDYTCTEDGYDLYVCTVCGEKERRVTDTASHVNEFISETAATCEDEGEQVFVCSVCGEKTVITTPPLGHEWSTGETEKKPTLFTQGSVKYVCKRDPSHVKYEAVSCEISTNRETLAYMLAVGSAVIISAVLSAIIYFAKKKDRTPSDL